MEHETFSEYTSKRTRIVAIYTIFIVSTLLLYIMRTFGFFVICLKISLRLHDSLFHGIIRACMHFFNTNSSGRILNRFSSDISNVDVALPQSMLDSLEVSLFDSLLSSSFSETFKIFIVCSECVCCSHYCRNW